MIFCSNYADLCHLLPKMQKENWLGVMGGIATQIESALIAGGSSPTCPFTPGALHISGQTFHLPEVPSILLTLAHVSTSILRGPRGSGGGGGGKGSGSPTGNSQSYRVPRQYWSVFY